LTVEMHTLGEHKNSEFPSASIYMRAKWVIIELAQKKSLLEENLGN